MVKSSKKKSIFPKLIIILPFFFILFGFLIIQSDKYDQEDAIRENSFRTYLSNRGKSVQARISSYEEYGGGRRSAGGTKCKSYYQIISPPIFQNRPDLIIQHFYNKNKDLCHELKASVNKVVAAKTYDGTSQWTRLDLELKHPSDAEAAVKNRRDGYATLLVIVVIFYFGIIAVGYRISRHKK